MDALIAHTECRDAYHRWQESAWLRGRTANIDFFFGGITFMEYDAAVTNTAGNSVNYVAAGTGICFTRRPGLFVDYRSPIDRFGVVNTMGLPMYNYIIGDGDRQETQIIHVESRPLPICTQPESLIRVSLT